MKPYPKPNYSDRQLVPDSDDHRREIATRLLERYVMRNCGVQLDDQDKKEYVRESILLADILLHQLRTTPPWEPNDEG